MTGHLYPEGGRLPLRHHLHHLRAQAQGPGQVLALKLYPKLKPLKISFLSWLRPLEDPRST